MEAAVSAKEVGFHAGRGNDDQRAGGGHQNSPYLPCERGAGMSK
ncbi:hypothetical protein FHT76_001495 [Rhizobium sp. BK176]|nr:hypothetical protein [Rhizobium sp. BK176]